MRSVLIGLFCWLLVLLPAAGQAADILRIAVLGTDTREGTGSLADFLTLEMTQNKAVEVVERSQIDKILAEQELGASDLAEGKNRVRLGQLLKADGLVLVQKEERPGKNKDDRFSIRLVETRDGF